MRSLVSVSLLALGCSAACGGSTSSSSTPSSDAGTTQTGGDAAVADGGSNADAGPDLGSDVYPAPHHAIPSMPYNGGAVLKNAKLVTVTYVGESQRDQLRAFDDAIVQGDWWAAVTEGYAINKGTSGGYVELDDDVSGKTLDDDADIKPYLLEKVLAGKLPAPDADTLYAIYFPSATTITLQGLTSCQGYGAYHNSVGLSVDGGTVEAAYAVIPDCGGGRTVSASHEFIEAATDAHPNSGWSGFNYPWFGAAGGEVGDACEFKASVLDQMTGMPVTRSWVNAAAAAGKDPCQPSATGFVYFNVAVDTNETGIVTPRTGGAYKTEGVVTVARGKSKTVPLQVYSQAPLPHDLTLSVGAQGRGRGANPSMLNPIASGITATLSSTTGRNGTHPTLTITADPTAAVADHLFVVRATLETNNYNSWPALLRVTN